jgi:uncharacterized damage-inducible protein DinB
MAIRDTLLPEFDQEMANTRKMLERAPQERFDYQPHAKSFKLDQLAGHLADLPSWVPMTLHTEVLELEPGKYKPFLPTSSQDLLAHFDKHVREARAAIAKASDEDMNTMWSMKWEGKTMMTMPRVGVLRSMVMNHLIHHRAQLGVYLRLCDVAVPGMYGPSADEKASDETPFGSSGNKAA